MLIVQFQDAPKRFGTLFQLYRISFLRLLLRSGGHRDVDYLMKWHMDTGVSESLMFHCQGNILYSTCEPAMHFREGVLLLFDLTNIDGH